MNKMSVDSETSLSERVMEILKELTPEEQQLVATVIGAERSKLHMKNPRNIKEELWKSVSEKIQ